ncbi:TetR family transcriptional regulator [Mycolicibacterium duvalii]|nr:helix-turn-helix transcriptional regulator [Mycolicibacterium duvalii]PEG44528.1 TetR family transcriptional regulator [Mycolicibacterium duvalii]
MDAAERSILQRGFAASTMELIAHEAGYSRAAMYRHFPSRQRLLEALVHRKTRRHQADMLARLPVDGTLADLLVESMVLVATELIHDPLLQTLSENTDEGTVAHLVANDPALPELVEQLVTALHDDAAAAQLRAGMRPGDVGQFLITTALTMLLGIIPGSDTPDTARRYLQTFVLPAILADPPPPRPVFER